MKKFLLLSMCACAFLSASAYKVAELDKAVAKAPISLAQNKYMTPKTYAQVATNVFKATRSEKVRAKLPSADDVYGMYICDVIDLGDGTTSFSKSNALTFSETVFYDEEYDATFNVEIDGIFGYGTVYGIFDEEEGTITIPVQYCYEHPQYGKMAFRGLSSADLETNQYGVLNDFVFDLEEDENGFYFVPAEGYIGYCVTFEEGQYQNSIGDLAFNEMIVMPANYIVTGESRNTLQPGAQWEDLDDYGVCLERVSDDSMFIHGFMGMGTVEVKFDEDDLGTIETYQPLEYAQIKQGIWDFIGPIAWDVDGQDIKVNNDREYIYCGFYTFTKNDTGEKIDAFALYDANSSVGWEYYSLGSKGLTEGGGFGPLCVLTMMVDNPDMPLSGIHNLKAEKISKFGSFNLAGQRVNNAKGLIIEDGKKVIR